MLAWSCSKKLRRKRWMRTARACGLLWLESPLKIAERLSAAARCILLSVNWTPSPDMNLRRFFILALILGATASLEWLLVPAPAAVRSTRLIEEPWKIPVRAVFSSQEALANLNTANLWGKLANVVQTSDVDPEWRFIGAMARGQERHVIIKKDNQQEQILVPGDTLPGGSKILGIENDRLCLLINGQKRNLYIYPQGKLSGKMSDSISGSLAR